jgi:hypothetical protein
MKGTGIINVLVGKHISVILLYSLISNKNMMEKYILYYLRLQGK